VYPILRFGHDYTFKTVDRGVIELVGPSGLVRFWLQVTQTVSRWQSGYVFNYVFSMVIGLLICIFFVRAGVDSIDLRFFMLFMALFVFKNVLPNTCSIKSL
jgi:hypothetical protein